MTTTESRSTPRSALGGVIVRATATGLVLGGVLAAVAAAVAGPEAARGAVVGAVVTIVIVAFGTASVGMVAHVMPAFSLVAALLTYVLQLVLLLSVLLALSRSGSFEQTVDRTWLAAGVVLATVTWAVSHVVLVTRLRIPLYALPEADER